MAETARADVALAARGLARSRTEGAALIRAGQVLLDGRPVRRPSDRVAADERKAARKARREAGDDPSGEER